MMAKSAGVVEYTEYISAEGVGRVRLPKWMSC